MTKCKKCGSTEVKWYETKAGKFYLIAKAGGPRDFHSKVCHLPLKECDLEWAKPECCQGHYNRMMRTQARSFDSAHRAISYHNHLNSKG